MRPDTRAALPRKYDAAHDHLAKVISVVPAFVYGAKVSIDRASDGRHLLVTATARTGAHVHIVVSSRGWVPASPAPAEVAEDGDGRTLTFIYTTDVPSHLGVLPLSYADRSRIVAGLLRQFMDPVDWGRLRTARDRCGSSFSV